MNNLIKLTQELSAPEAITKTLMAKMSSFFDEVEAQKAVIEGIVVTEPSQLAEMQQARGIRLMIAKKRFIARDIVKDEREKLKNAMSDFKLQDTLWLKSFQMLEAVCDNLEGKCEEKEKFAERYAAEQKQLRYESRVRKLYQFGTDPGIYALADMADEAFDKLLDKERLAHEACIAAQKKAQADEEAAVKAEQDRQEAIRKENADLKAQAVAATAAAELKERELAKEREVQQKILDDERKAREAVEATARAAKEAQAQKEAAEAARLDTLKKAQEDEDRKKLLAPDKEKLLEIAHLIDQIGLPSVQSSEAQSVIRATQEMLGKVTNYIREKAKTL